MEIQIQKGFELKKIIWFLNPQGKLRETKFSDKGMAQVRTNPSGKFFATIGLLEHRTGFSICSLVIKSYFTLY